MNWLGVVGLHHRRWETIILESDQLGLGLMQVLLDGLQISLKSLTLNIRDHGVLGELPRTSALQHLSLGHVTPSEGLSLTGRHLTTLALHCMAGVSAPKVSAVLGILSTCPGLRTLKIEKLYPPFTDDVDVAGNPISLPNLRVLNITDVPEVFAQDLLRHLQTDNLTSCTIDLECEVTAQTNILGPMFTEGVVAAPPPLLLLRKSNNRTLYTRVSLYRASATIQGSEHILKIVLRSEQQGVNLGVSFQLLHPLMSLVPEVNLELRGRIVNYAKFLDNTPNLTILLLRNAWSSQQIVKYLADREVQSTCPRLRVLRAEGFTDRALATRVIRARQPRFDMMWGPGGGQD